MSEFTGSAHCLSGALLINPWDEEAVAHTIYKALTSSEEEKAIRCAHNRSYVLKNTSQYWIENFLKELIHYKKSLLTEAKPINESVLQEVTSQYNSSKKRIFLCELEGTLTAPQLHPSLLIPSSTLLSTLKDLIADEKNQVWILSSRDRKTLKRWFADPRYGLVAEDGNAFYFPNSQEWQERMMDVDLSWQALVKPVFNDFTDTTPGSETEISDVSITWFYRGVDPVYGEYQKNNLLLHLQGLPNLPIEVFSGEQFVGVRLAGVNKGSSVKRILEESREEAEFVLCFGSELMFDELRKHLFTFAKSVVVDKGIMKTTADYFLRQDKILPLLRHLIQGSQQQIAK